MAVRRMLVAGRYRLHEPVGAGGMGRVWMARDEMLDRDVAVKEFVPPDWMTDDERNRLRDRTLREARSAARLNHPHVVRIYDVVHADGLPWIVMEYVPSRSLYQVIVDEGPLAPVTAARIGLDVLSALTAAHRAGVLHRDVKPHNVLIGHDGRVVLTDFGLATFVDDGSVTGPGLIVGSPQYVSPERARDGASTVASDMWSLGATLYAAVEGRSPYARETAMATLTALATEPPDPAVFAGELGPVISGLLQHEPADRLTAAEVEERLRAVVGQLPARTVSRVNGRAVIPIQRVPGGGAKPKALADVVTKPEPPTDRNAPPVNGVKPMLPRANEPPTAAQPAVPVGRRPPAPERQPAAVPPSPISALPVTAPPDRPGRGRLTTVILLTVALLGAAGATTAVLLRADDPRPPSAGAVLPPAPATSSAGPGGFSAVVCNAPPPDGLPETPQRGASRTHTKTGFALLPGFSIYTDAVAGFRLAVPDGWTYERIGTTVCFRDTNNIRVMSLDYGRNPNGNPVAACKKERDRLVAAKALPRYEEIGITPLTLIKAADWEYSYEFDDQRVHSATRWFVNSGRGFAMSWTTREFDWRSNLEILRMIQATFTGAK